MKNLKLKISIVILWFLTIVIFNFFSIGIIASTSMEPSLTKNKFIIAPKTKIFKNLKIIEQKSIDYGDMVLFYGLDGDMHLKRVIGKPNDIIDFKNGKIFVNNNEIKLEKINENTNEIFYKENNSYKIKRIKKYMKNNDKINERFVMPEKAYFLLGDNRDDSFDSRMFKKNIYYDDIIAVYFNK